MTTRTASPGPEVVGAVPADRWRRWLAAILLGSVLLRLAAALYMGGPVEVLPGIDDQRSYHMLAQRLLAGHGFTVAADWWPMTRSGAPTAHWSYLYTLYLAGSYTLFGVHPLAPRVIQAVLVGLLWPLLTFRIGRRLAGERIGLLAAAWSGFYGYFVYYAAALMTEPFFITAILWSLDLALGMAAGRRDLRRWLLLSLATGTAVLLRQSYLLFVPFLLGWAWTADHRGRAVELLAWSRLRGPLLALAVLAALILPWTLRNYHAFGRFVLLNTNAGYAFFWANHPVYGAEFTGILPAHTSYQSLVPQELRHLDEAALDSALMARGLAFVVDDPGRYALLSLSRVKTYFMFWPSSDSLALSNVVRVLSFGVALPFMLWGLALGLGRWRSWSLLYLFVLIYTGIHLLSWALVRYRLPVDAVLLVFAAAALEDLRRRLPAARLRPSLVGRREPSA